jgi:hypothetical protein
MSVHSLLQQIGNIAILLDEGDPDDTYDFLELYIQGWEDEADKVKQRCNGGRKARQLAEELKSDSEEIVLDSAAHWNMTVTSRNLRAGRKLPAYPLHDPRYFDDRTKPPVVSRPPYYDRTWTPYDPYIRANTEVRTNPFVTALSSTPHTLTCFPPFHSFYV